MGLPNQVTIVWLILALLSFLNLHLHQIDVHNVFLHGDLDEEVYIYLPKGITPSYPNQVCKLLKSIYRLKQSNRLWFGKLSTILLTNKFKQCSSDHSLFIHKSQSHFTFILIYIYDLLITGNNVKIIEQIKQLLQHHFHIKDLGTLKHI